MMKSKMLWPSLFIALFSVNLAACSDSTDATSHVGYVEAEWVYVAAPANGWIIDQPVQEGDQVKAGDILFELDKEQQQAAVAESSGHVEQAEANLQNLTTGARPAEIRALQARLEETKARRDQAILDRDRILPLVKRGVETPNRGDQAVTNVEVAQANVKAAQEAIAVAKLAGRDSVQQSAKAAVETAVAALENAQWHLGQRTITAQNSGRIEQIFRRKGEFVTAGNPIISLLPKEGLIIKFFVTQRELATLQLGQTVNVKTDGMADAFKATISFISKNAEFTPPVIYSKDTREKLVFLVKARVPSDMMLRPGLPVDVDL